MRATINASPLIFLARLGRLELLGALLSEFYVSTAVYRECVGEGLEHGYVEAELIRKFVEARVRPVEQEGAKQLAERFNIHLGEASTLLLALKSNFQHVVVDDRVAIKVAKILGLRPISTPFILLSALRRGILTYEAFIDCFNNLIELGYHLSYPLARSIIETAEKFKEGR